MKLIIADVCFSKDEFFSVMNVQDLLEELHNIQDAFDCPIDINDLYNQFSEFYDYVHDKTESF